MEVFLKDIFWEKCQAHSLTFFDFSNKIDLE